MLSYDTIRRYRTISSRINIPYFILSWDIVDDRRVYIIYFKLLSSRPQRSKTIVLYLLSTRTTQIQ